MHTHKTHFDSGTLLFLGTGKDVDFIQPIKSGEMTIKDEYISLGAEPMQKIIDISGEMEMTFKMTASQALKCADIFLGLARSMYEICPNGRIVQLTKRARKHRTRKKNRQRMTRLLERIAEKED